MQFNTLQFWSFEPHVLSEHRCTTVGFVYTESIILSTVLCLLYKILLLVEIFFGQTDKQGSSHIIWWDTHTKYTRQYTALCGRKTSCNVWRGRVADLWF